MLIEDVFQEGSFFYLEKVLTMKILLDPGHQTPHKLFIFSEIFYP